MIDSTVFLTTFFTLYPIGIVVLVTILARQALIEQKKHKQVRRVLIGSMARLSFPELLALTGLLQRFDLRPPPQVYTWVTYFPFVWLPSILVAFAFFMYLLIFRKLLMLTRG